MKIKRIILSFLVLLLSVSTLGSASKPAVIKITAGFFMSVSAGPDTNHTELDRYGFPRRVYALWVRGNLNG